MEIIFFYYTGGKRESYKGNWVIFWSINGNVYHGESGIVARSIIKRFMEELARGMSGFKISKTKTDKAFRIEVAEIII